MSNPVQAYIFFGSTQESKEAQTTRLSPYDQTPVSQRGA